MANGYTHNFGFGLCEMKSSSSTIATPISPAISDACATDDLVYREIMKFAVAAVCKMAGFTHIEPKAHRLLSQLMNNCKCRQYKM